jgi:glycosyltransferase involved in cell wall biosynthesis
MSATVLHVVVAGDIGGAERLLVDLASRPSHSGVTHAVALMTPNPKLREYLVGSGLRVIDRGPVRENPMAYLWRSLGPSDTAWLAEVLTREDARIAHLHTFQSHVVGTRAALRVGAKILRTEHHVQYFVDPSTSAFTRWSLKRAHSIVAISDYVAEFVARTAPDARTRIRTVRNGVDADYFTPRPFPASASPDAPFTFVVVCRLEPWKQVELVVDAMRGVPGAQLIVAGDGTARADLEARARPLGSRVRFLGYCADPRDAFAQGHVAVSSARDEPLGLSVLEAQAMGRPVVAFAGGGIPEVVRDGETGWLVRERSVDALAARMREASADVARAKAMGDAARRFVDAEHRVERMCEGYGAAYASLV